MKILIKQFLGANHSWAVTGRGIAQGLINLGHDVQLFSTDGIKNLPASLKSNLIGYVEENQSKVVGRLPDNNYDCQISYTAMRNFANYLSNGNKNRFGIWTYEWGGKNVLPNGFAKSYIYSDYILAPSNFSKQIFLDSGVPDNHIKVIPHGINSIDYNKTNTISFSTNKKFKILSVLTQNHIRKNIPGMLNAYGKAFSNKDDVCLIIKGKGKAVNQSFEVSLDECLAKFKKTYPNHAEIKLYPEFIEDMSILYRSVDCLFALSNCEGFFFPALEALASGKLVIAPNWGGQLDFLNESNSLLINGKETRANPRSMYWEQNNNAIWFEPNIDDAVNKLQLAYKDYEYLNQKNELQKAYIHNEYDWTNITNKIINLCE